nr:hypothetical protein [Tanacetum cinerariifolium]
MEEMLYKFIDEGRREHKEMGEFIREFKTTNELLLKERNNSLSELKFKENWKGWNPNDVPDIKDMIQSKAILGNLKLAKIMNSAVNMLTGEKSLAAIQELFEQSTLNVDVGVMTAATVPFVTSSVTPTLEHKDGETTDSVFVANLWTQRLSERFVISSDSSHNSSANVVDDEVTSIVRSFMPPPTLMTAAVATTAISDATFTLVPEVSAEPVPRSIFRDSDSPSTTKANVAGPSQPAEAEVEEAIRLRSQVSVIEATEATRVAKLNSLKERIVALEGQLQLSSLWSLAKMPSIKPA